MPKFIDLTGKRFKRLLVIKRAEDKVLPCGKKVVRWFCLCDCGKNCTVNSKELMSGITNSCGCYGAEQRKKAHFKPYVPSNRLIKIYSHMIERCYSQKDKRYKDYGGRGIVVCDEWLSENGRKTFYDWAVKNGYRDDLTIDRKDVNGNYEPNNCRWATKKEQSLNRRSNKYINYKGKIKTISEWAEQLKCNAQTLYYRKNNGWSDKDIIEIPIKNLLKA
jgi:hypothetical protein